MSCSGSNSGDIKCDACQWQDIMWLIRRVEGKEVQPHFAQFVFIITVEVVFDHFHGFPDDAGIVNVDVCQEFSFTEFDAVFVTTLTL
jgi:hypothetical protein